MKYNGMTADIDITAECNGHIYRLYTTGDDMFIASDTDERFKQKVRYVDACEDKRYTDITEALENEFNNLLSGIHCNPIGNERVDIYNNYAREREDAVDAYLAELTTSGKLSGTTMRTIYKDYGIDGILEIEGWNNGSKVFSIKLLQSDDWTVDDVKARIERITKDM